MGIFYSKEKIKQYYLSWYGDDKIIEFFIPYSNMHVFVGINRQRHVDYWLKETFGNKDLRRKQ